MSENEATVEPAGLPSESQWRPSALMTVYDEPAAPTQNATEAVPNEGQVLPANGTEPQAETGGEPASAEIDANSPAARHFQSVADKMIAKAKSEADAAMSQVRAELAETRARLSQLSDERSSTAQQAGQNGGAGLDWTTAPKFKLPEGGAYDEAAMADAIDRVQNEKIEWTIQQLRAQGVREQQMMQVQTAEQALTGFYQTLPPASQQEFIGLVKDAPDLARNNPERFLRIAKAELGVGDSLQTQEMPAPQKLANQSQVIPSSRPTTNRGAPAARFSPEATLEDIVRANVRRQA